MLGIEGRAGTARVDLREWRATGRVRWCKQAVTGAGQQIDPAAARLVAERAGTDIARLRGDVERLLLYAVGAPKITLDDARQVVSAETAQDDWAVTNAIQRGDTAEALRQIALAMDSGGVSVHDPRAARVVRARAAVDDGSAAGAGGDRGAVPDRPRAQELGRRPRCCSSGSSWSYAVGEPSRPGAMRP